MWMSEGEIVTSYRQAANPAKQIKILAQINDVHRTVIEEILIKRGLKVRRAVKTERRYQKWTPEDTATLKQLYLAGVSREQIADTIGRSYTATKSKLAEMGLVSRHIVRHKEILR